MDWMSWIVLALKVILNSLIPPFNEFLMFFCPALWSWGLVTVGYNNWVPFDLWLMIWPQGLQDGIKSLWVLFPGLLLPWPVLAGALCPPGPQLPWGTLMDSWSPWAPWLHLHSLSSLCISTPGFDGVLISLKHQWCKLVMKQQLQEVPLGQLTSWMWHGIFSIFIHLVSLNTWRKGKREIAMSHGLRVLT